MTAKALFNTYELLCAPVPPSCAVWGPGRAGALLPSLPARLAARAAEARGSSAPPGQGQGALWVPSKGQAKGLLLRLGAARRCLAGLWGHLMCPSRSQTSLGSAPVACRWLPDKEVAGAPRLQARAQSSPRSVKEGNCPQQAQSLTTRVPPSP